MQYDIQQHGNILRAIRNATASFLLHIVSPSSLQDRGSLIVIIQTQLITASLTSAHAGVDLVVRINDRAKSFAAL